MRRLAHAREELVGKHGLHADAVIVVEHGTRSYHLPYVVGVGRALEEPVQVASHEGERQERRGRVVLGGLEHAVDEELCVCACARVPKSNRASTPWGST